MGFSPRPVAGYLENTMLPNHRVFNPHKLLDRNTVEKIWSQKDQV